MTWGVGSYSTTPASNSNCNGINIAEGCAASGIDDTLRQIMADIANYIAGTSGTTGSESTSGNAGTATKLATARSLTFTGDVTGGPTNFDGSANISIALTEANSGATAGAYTNASVTVDAKGRVTAASNGATPLKAANNLSDVANVATALSNLGITSFVSGNHTPSVSTAYSDAHGLGNLPSVFNVRLYIKCATAELGYSVGDVLPITDNGSGSGSNANASVWINNTNVGFTVAPNGVVIARKDTGQQLAITPANWNAFTVVTYGV